MNRVLMFFVLIFWMGNIFAQSAWDIGYIAGDSINSVHVGREVRIDFKSQYKAEEGRFYRRFLSRQDTGMLVINNENISMLEVRKIYPDWGLYREQYLESVNFVIPGIKIRVGSSILKQVSSDSILISTNVETYKIKKKNKSELVESKSYDIWIERDKLSGLLYRNR
jgi:hypothetical protein